MDPEQLSLEEIESLTKQGVDEIAPLIGEIEKDMSDPENDIFIFANHMRGMKMIDIGCGWARYAHLFIDHHFDYTGIDLSPKMIEIARARNPGITFREMSFRKLDFPDASFDGAWSCCALLHEPKRNLQAVLAEMKRVVVPEGLIYIILPDMDESSECMRKIRKTLTTPVYWSRWEYDEFLISLEEARLSLIESVRWEERGTMTFLCRT